MWTNKGKLWQKSHSRIQVNLPEKRGDGLTVFGALMSKDSTFEYMLADKTTTY